ncbi:MAG TPA: hypothetical protein VGE11_14450 [Pseudonocardia sp.]
MYQLRLFCDTVSPDMEVAGVGPAPPSISYLYRGSATVAGAEIKQGEATYFRDDSTIRAGSEGATIWRWEITRREADLGVLRGEGVVSRLRMAREVKMFELVPTSKWLFRLDNIIGFQGTTGLHSHPGSGIRCMIEGHLRAESSKGENSENSAPGDVWYEEGAYPLVSTVDPGMKADFLRGMILPPEYYGFADSAVWISGQPEGGPKVEGHRALVDQIITLT